MRADFLDTSALAKHYHAEVGSAEVDRLWNDSGRGLFISRLSALEIMSVFAAKVRAGTITAEDFKALRGHFSADMTKTKRLVGTRLLVTHYQEAERLLREHAPIRRLRTLDALQLAVAIDLYRSNAIQRVISSDEDSLVVASVEGLGVFDPENP